jgi:hypothetical protein
MSLPTHATWSSPLRYTSSPVRPGKPRSGLGLNNDALGWTAHHGGEHQAGKTPPVLSLASVRARVRPRGSKYRRPQHAPSWAAIFTREDISP